MWSLRRFAAPLLLEMLMGRDFLPENYSKRILAE